MPKAMLDAEKVQRVISYLTPIAESSTVGTYGDNLKLAIEALEKQVPQKVKKYKGLNETACPECGIAFGYYEYDDEKFDYCYNCGQKLDWESEVEHNG